MINKRSIYIFDIDPVTKKLKRIDPCKQKRILQLIEEQKEQERKEQRIYLLTKISEKGYCPRECSTSCPFSSDICLLLNVPQTKLIRNKENNYYKSLAKLEIKAIIGKTNE